MVSLISLFTCLEHNVSLYSVLVVFSDKLNKKKPSVHHFLLSIKLQTDTVGDQLVNIMEHLAAEDPDVSPREVVETKNRAERAGISN